MIVFESRKVRRIIGRLERGERVVEAFEELARARNVTTGWIRAIGHLEWAELRRYDPRARRWQAPERVEAPCRIVSLEGSVSYGEAGAPQARLQTTLARETPGGTVTFGGELLDAGAFDVELVVECSDDLGLRRERDADTGLPLWRGASSRARSAPPERAPEPEKPSPRTPSPAPRTPSPVPRTPDGPVSWSQVAAVSATPRSAPTSRRGILTEAREPAPVPDPIPEKRRIDPSEILDEPTPEAGDYVDHKVFGLCRVEGDAEGGIVIRLPSGRRKHINLDVLEVMPARIEGDRIVYPLRPRRR